MVTFDLADEEITFKELIPEDPNAVLESVSSIRDDLLIVTYSRDVSHSTCNFALEVHPVSGPRVRC